MSIKTYYAFDRLTSFVCVDCSATFSIVFSECPNCNAQIPEELLPIISFELSKLDLRPTMEEPEKLVLFFQHFNDEGNVIEGMTLEQKEDRLAKLESMAFEISARKQKVAKDISDARKHKSIDIDGEINVNDAIQTVQDRKKRISRSEKMMKGLADLIGADKAAEIHMNLDKARFNPDSKPITERMMGIKSAVLSAMCQCDRHSDCVGSFKDDTGSKTCKCKCHDKPFDPNDPFA